MPSEAQLAVLILLSLKASPAIWQTETFQDQAQNDKF
jgi:hypothetical protein